MSTITAQLVDVSGESGALEVGQGGLVVVSVRNTLANGGLMVSTVWYSANSGKTWSALQEFSSVDGDFIKRNAPAGLYKVAGVVDLSAGGGAAATVDYVVIAADCNADKSMLVATTSAEQSTDIGVGDHIKFDTVIFQRGCNAILDTATVYDQDASVLGQGVLLLKEGASYLVQVDSGPSAFSGAGTLAVLLATPSGYVSEIPVYQEALSAGNAQQASLRTVVTPVSGQDHVVAVIAVVSNLTSIGLGAGANPVITVQEI